MKTILTIEDVIENSCYKNYENQICVIKSEALADKYKNAKYQVFEAKSGFGCDPTKMGSAVFGTFLIDGENTRMERYDFLGIIKPEVFEEWKKENLS